MAVLSFLLELLVTTALETRQIHRCVQMLSEVLRINNSVWDNCSYWFVYSRANILLSWSGLYISRYVRLAQSVHHMAKTCDLRTRRIPVLSLLLLYWQVPGAQSGEIPRCSSGFTQHFAISSGKTRC